MSNVNLVNPAATTANRKEILDQVHSAFGVIPNMFKAAANSPATLQKLWGGFGALGSGVIGAKLGEKIAVAVANQNGCEYCLAAHTAIGKGAGVSIEDLRLAQQAQSSDAKTAAALGFAVKLVKQRAQVTAADFQSLRSHGFSDEEIVEIIAHVAHNIFTNYINISLDVPLDFPAVSFAAAA